MIRPLTAKEAAGYAAQFVIDERCELLKDRLIARLQTQQQAGDIPGWRRHW
jgi:hypothetical protein